MNGTAEKIRVLIVDDESPPVRELKARLENLDESHFQFDVTWAESIADYQRIVANATFTYDVLIADIRLERESPVDMVTAADAVVPLQLLHSPSTIVIFYSVFTEESGDPIPAAISTCVHAMRMGAADCIRKGKGSSERLVKSIIRELTERRCPSLVFDTSWWTSQRETLQKSYAGQAIAVLGKEVIAAAPTVRELREKLRGNDVTNLIRSRPEYTPLPKIIVIPDLED